MLTIISLFTNCTI